MHFHEISLKKYHVHICLRIINALYKGKIAVGEWLKYWKPAVIPLPNLSQNCKDLSSVERKTVCGWVWESLNAMLCQVSTDIKWISSLKHILLNLCSSENRQTKKIQAQCLGLINPCSPAAGPSHLCCGQTHLLTDTELCHDTLANTSPYTSRG